MGFNYADIDEVSKKYNPEKLKNVGEEAQRTIPETWPKIIDEVAENYERVVKEFNVRLQVKE